jgi:hypothetical protein
VFAVRLFRVRAREAVLPAVTLNPLTGPLLASSTAPIPSASTLTIAGTTSATALPTSTGSSTVPTLKKFDAAAAQAALEALMPDLIACKLAVGAPYKVKLIFTPDGHVASSAALGRIAGTPPGTCVSTRLRKATVAPFSGRSTPYIYTFPARPK